MGMDELWIKKWSRYGNARLYVNHGSGKGTSVAWLDLDSGRVEILDETYRQAALARLAPWLRAATPPPPPALASPPRLPPLTPSQDLRTNPPGAELARLVREAQPGRFRLLMRRLLALEPGPAESRWRAGLEGERLAAAVLDGLKPHGWLVLHSVRLYRTADTTTDIDHLLIGPPGVFTVNTKHHPGARIRVGSNTVLVNGSRTEYLRNSRTEARRATHRLTHWCGFPVTANPVLLIVGTTRITLDTPTPPLPVLPTTTLEATLTALPPTIPPPHLTTLHTTAPHRTVWESPPPPRPTPEPAPRT